MKTQTDSVVYSCQICGMKPELTKCNMSYQYKCACGVSGAKSAELEQAKRYWNSIAYCSNWLV